MRSSLLLGAVCAASGVLASPVDVEKRALETEWTAWTVTTSTTEAAGPAPPTDAPAQKVQISTIEEPPTTTTLPPVIIGAQNTQQPQAQPQPEPQTQAQQQQQEPQTQAQQQQPEPQTQAQQQQQQPPATQPAPETVSTSTAAPTTTGSGSGSDKNNLLNNVLPTAWTTGFATAWTSTPTQAAQSSAPTSGGAPPANHYQETLLYNHNVHRSNHSAGSLGWSDSLASSAQKLAAKCVYEHDTSIDGGGYGQNIGYGVEEDNIGQMITNLMYNDEMGLFSALYGLASPLMELFDSWGHFSQIIWKSTTEVGCATVVCDKLGNVDSGSSLPFTVCNYNPPGNSNGEYADNVLKPLGNPMLQI